MKPNSINRKQMSSLLEYNSTNTGTFYSEYSMLSIVGMDFFEVSLLSLWVMSDTLMSRWPKAVLLSETFWFLLWSQLQKSHIWQVRGKYWPTVLQQFRLACPLPEPSFWEVGLMNNLWCKRGLFKSLYQGFWFKLTLQRHRSEKQRFKESRQWIQLFSELFELLLSLTH